jgi:hypothetical protein
MEGTPKTGFEEFRDALAAKADVVIEDVSRPGPLSTPEAMATIGFFDARQEELPQVSPDTGQKEA